MMAKVVENDDFPFADPDVNHFVMQSVMGGMITGYKITKEKFYIKTTKGVLEFTLVDS